MKVTNALVTGDELNTFMTVISGSTALTGNQCRTVNDIQTHYYTNIWASPWPYLASNRLPVYQWILPSSQYIASQGQDYTYGGECYFYPNQYEVQVDYYVNFTSAMPGNGQVNVTYVGGSGQTILFYTGYTSVNWTAFGGCPDTPPDIYTVEILFY